MLNKVQASSWQIFHTPHQSSSMNVRSTPDESRSTRYHSTCTRLFLWLNNQPAWMISLIKLENIVLLLGLWCWLRSIRPQRYSSWAKLQTRFGKLGKDDNWKELRESRTELMISCLDVCVFGCEPRTANRTAKFGNGHSKEKWIQVIKKSIKESYLISSSVKKCSERPR